MKVVEKEELLEGEVGDMSRSLLEREAYVSLHQLNINAEFLG